MRKTAIAEMMGTTQENTAPNLAEITTQKPKMKQKGVFLEENLLKAMDYHIMQSKWNGENINYSVIIRNALTRYLKSEIAEVTKNV